jgi:hypothetical protein
MIEDLYNKLDEHQEESGRLWDAFRAEPYAHDLMEAAELQDWYVAVYRGAIFVCSALIEPGVLVPV